MLKIGPVRRFQGLKELGEIRRLCATSYNIFFSRFSFKTGFFNVESELVILKLIVFIVVLTSMDSRLRGVGVMV